MNELIKPVYDIQKVFSSVNLLEWKGINEVADNLENGYMVLWQHHAIFTGKVEDKVICWLSGSPELGDIHFVRLRAFNESKEYHYWKGTHSIEGRLRDDLVGTEIEVVDACMVLRSVVGRVIQQPLCRIISRNYILYDDDTGQAGYRDSRFVNFIA